MSENFTCGRCDKVIEIEGTYRHSAAYCGDERICLPCAANETKRTMRLQGKSALYLSESAMCVTDWAMHLKFPIYGLKKSYHNFAGTNGRRDFYFDFEGFVWHGVNIGDQDWSRVRKTKRKA